MVTQEKIVNYLKNNPGRSENQIMEECFDYYRNESIESNKKYAECLRRALKANKIYRLPVINKSYRYVYFYQEPNYLSPHQLIPGKWYYGILDENEWIFQFLEIKDNELSHSKAVCINSKNKYDGGYFHICNFTHLQLASQQTILQYFPQEFFRPEPVKEEQPLVVSLPEVRKKLAELVTNQTEQFCKDMISEITAVKKRNDGDYESQLEEIEDFVKMSDITIILKYKALEMINDPKKSLFEICSYLTDQDEVWGPLFENEGEVLSVLFGEKVKFNVK